MGIAVSFCPSPGAQDLFGAEIAANARSSVAKEQSSQASYFWNDEDSTPLGSDDDSSTASSCFGK
jgi:hypothetical protein